MYTYKHIFLSNLICRDTAYVSNRGGLYCVMVIMNWSYCVLIYLILVHPSNYLSIYLAIYLIMSPYRYKLWGKQDTISVEQLYNNGGKSSYQDHAIHTLYMENYVWINVNIHILHIY